MRTTVRKVAGGLAAAGAGAVLALAAPGAPAQAAVSCYGGASFYNKPEGGFHMPAGIYFSTSNRCSDINIRTNNNTFVQVCFTNNRCQPTYVRALSGRWTVVATNVRDNVFFRFQFYNDGPTSGYWAA